LMQMEVDIPGSLEGERLDRALASLTGLSRTVVAALIADGVVALNGKVISKSSEKVVEGQVLTAQLPEAVDSTPQPEADVPFTVVYEDEHLAVIDKPAGVVVHPGNGNETGTLVNGLLHRFPDLAETRPGDVERPGIVHRLDAGTSGLLVMARTQEAYDQLVEAMASHHAIERGYFTMVWGELKPERGSIDAPIGRSDRDRTRMAVRSGGKEAITHYEVLAYVNDPSMTVIRAQLETGRTHQIRVHFTAIGHPVVGDKRYRGSRAALKLDRPFLHARSLKFTHPITAEELEFTSAVPDDLVGVLNDLGVDPAVAAS
jgi:23S rRNA pseudouridine1911/1915/1917 synthase